MDSAVFALIESLAHNNFSICSVGLLPEGTSLFLSLHVLTQNSILRQQKFWSKTRASPLGITVHTPFAVLNCTHHFETPKRHCVQYVFCEDEINLLVLVNLFLGMASLSMLLAGNCG